LSAQHELQGVNDDVADVKFLNCVPNGGQDSLGLSRPMKGQEKEGKFLKLLCVKVKLLFVFYKINFTKLLQHSQQQGLVRYLEAAPESAHPLFAKIKTELGQQSGLAAPCSPAENRYLPSPESFNLLVEEFKAFAFDSKLIFVAHELVFSALLQLLEIKDVHGGHRFGLSDGLLDALWLVRFQIVVGVFPILVAYPHSPCPVDA
jgi:hypothetical protein